MTMMVLDRNIADRLLAEREASGADRFDEVWEGVYMMAPPPNNEHQDLVGGLHFALHASIVPRGLGRVQPGANVSDREGDDWVDNYRGPDVVVVLNGGVARDSRTHWFGGPDFVIEIVSRHDRSRDKFEFYASVGVRELLLVDRFPWMLELYRLDEGKMGLVASAQPGDGVVLASKVVPHSFQLLTGSPRPQIEVTQEDGAQRWLV